MLDLDPSDLITVKKILATYVPEMTVWAYGSRVKGTSHAGSDLDLVIIDTKSDNSKPEYLSFLQTIFSESDLPISVDILNWSNIPEKFRKEIEKVHEILQKPNIK